MTCWPEHYPEQCPPQKAYFHSGELYRFINRNNPVAKDFESYYEKDPQKDWGNQSCQARGLSVVKSALGIKEMRDAIPSLRRKKVSKAVISLDCGMLADTPSSSSQNHCTWWVPKSISKPEKLFTTTDESELEYV
ncbi:hypothetical protein [Aeromonas hydrophila]|uniref:hypothetical protein n=1 Tax=Aeromonas hydrophila TaxID=644 RepID=UPI001A90B989|nr:hypothetical protein [Aeromonas hydrophila]